MVFLRRQITKSEEAIRSPIVLGSATSVGSGVSTGSGVSAISLIAKPMLASLKASLPTLPPILPNTVL